MTEYLDDEYGDSLEGDDYDLLDRIEALEDEQDEAEEVAEVQAQINQLQAMHGAPFTQAEVQQIGELIDEGYTPESVYEAVAPAHPGEQAFDNQFVETVEHVQEQQGRPLANSEVQNLYEQAAYLGDPRHVDDSAVRDLTKKQDRISLANERILEHDPPAATAETVEPLSEDSTPQERIAYMDARVNGAEVETYEGETE